MTATSEIARDATAVTTSDTADNTYAYLYVGGTGNVKVTTEAGTDVTFTSVPVGYLWVRTRLVWATGTTATNIVGLKA
jgi:hypothetical protein